MRKSCYTLLFLLAGCGEGDALKQNGDLNSSNQDSVSPAPAPSVSNRTPIETIIETDPCEKFEAIKLHDPVNNIDYVIFIQIPCDPRPYIDMGDPAPEPMKNNRKI